MDEVTAERDAGALPEDQIGDVVYRRPGRGPDGHHRGALPAWDLPLSEEFRRPSRRTWQPPHQPGAATTTPSPTPASTWPRTGPWSPLPGALRRPLRGLSPRRRLAISTETATGDRRRRPATRESRPWSRPAGASPPPTPPRPSDAAARRPAPSAPACSPPAGRRCRASSPRPGPDRRDDHAPATRRRERCGRLVVQRVVV